MLLNDITRKDRMDTVHARDLQNEVVRHHKNNPQSSMEAAFEYIVLNSATFRALPTVCIEKARRYLDLPIVGIKPKEVTSEYNPSLFLVTQNEITPIGWRHIISDNSADTLESPAKPKPGTTVVHAERVVIDNRKMIKILEFENVQKLCELPNKYCAHFPYFYALSDRSYIGICINLAQSFRVKVGEVITIKEFDQMIKTMKDAAVRLAKINKTVKLENEHSGKFTVSI